MKIIQVIPNLGLGGAEIMCENLSTALSHQGHNILIISLYAESTIISKRIERAGIPIYTVNKHRGFDFSVFIRLIEIFKKEKPDIVHTHLYAGKYVIPAAFLAGVPKIIYTVHNIAEKESKKSGRRLNSLFFRMKRVIPVALSDIIQKTIISYYHIPARRVPVVLNGIPLDKCIPKTDYTRKKEFSVIHVGRMSPQKNHLEMIKAIALLVKEGAPVHLTMIGDGELRDEVQKKIKEYALENAITWIPQTDNVYPYLHDADAFLLPSNYEGIPMSIIEAMGTGLPIIASAVGGVPDMLKDGYSGLLCTPHAESIANKVKQMMNNLELRKKCGLNALQQSSVFSAETMAERYYVVYTSSNVSLLNTKWS